MEEAYVNVPTIKGLVIYSTLKLSHSIDLITILPPIALGTIIEPRHEKTGVLHMRKQRRRSASQ